MFNPFSQASQASQGSWAADAVDYRTFYRVGQDTPQPVPTCKTDWLAVVAGAIAGAVASVVVTRMMK